MEHNTCAHVLRRGALPYFKFLGDMLWELPHGSIEEYLMALCPPKLLVMEAHHIQRERPLQGVWPTVDLQNKMLLLY